MFYSVCVSALFSKTPLQEAIGLVKQAGYDTCEFWSWWDKDLATVKAALDEHQVRLSAMCTRFVPLNDPAKRQEYLDGLAETLKAAELLDCRTIISQVGQEQPHLSREEQTQSIVDGLKVCVPLLEKAGVTLVIEPLNTKFDHPGYFLARSDEAFAIVRKVNSPYVKVLFDIYHQQITEGNLIPNITGNAEWIDHIHMAGHPGRHEPFGRNEIHYPSVLAALKEAGYTGAIGLEYFPQTDPMESLQKLLKEVPL
ncbi:MAG: TIM barrel protein [Clostridia bacterium]|nr:TIM barrel protein [Clostridia bacterium]